MEKTVLEVDDKTAKAWKLASARKRKALSSKLSAANSGTQFTSISSFWPLSLSTFLS